jgi:hypothetical protein
MPSVKEIFKLLKKPGERFFIELTHDLPVA